MLSCELGEREPTTQYSAVHCVRLCVSFNKMKTAAIYVHQVTYALLVKLALHVPPDKYISALVLHFKHTI